MKRIGIYSGSFDPVHIGHTALASWIVQSGYVDEVWMLVSPLNPLKQGSAPPAEADRRLDMVRIATAASPRLRADDTELQMPRPSYTYDTLLHLSHTHLDCTFTLIVGSDNLEVFDRWRNAEAIRTRFGLLVYPRPGHPLPTTLPPGVTEVTGAPTTDISSTFIRRAVARGMDCTYWTPPGVAAYIKEHKLYHISQDNDSNG